MGTLRHPSIVEIQRPIPTQTWSTTLYFSLPFMLFDPLNQFPIYFSNGKIFCPMCLRDGIHTSTIIDSGQWKNGNSERVQPRLIYNVGGPFMLVSKLYKCENGHREVVACDPDITKQIPDSLISFITSHRSGITKNLLNLCEQLLDKGISLLSIEDLNKERYEALYNLMRDRFLTDLNICRSLGYTSESVTAPNFKELRWSFPGSIIISSAIISNFEKLEDKYRELFSGLAAEWISCDHTYKSVANIGYRRESDRKWIKQYRGQPLQWRFTKTEKFDEVSHAFCQLATHFKKRTLSQIKGIYTDTCCKWTSKLLEIFPEVPIKLDLFHTVQHFTSSIPKRKQYHAEISRNYSLVFRSSTDLGVARLANTPESSVLLQNMDKFEKKWKEVKYSTGEAVLNTNAMKEIENIKVHVRKGCLSGIPPGCGTNRNERLNRHLNQFLLNNKISVPLAYVRCFRLFSQLKCMDTIAKDTALTTSSVPRHIPYEDANDQCLPLPLESFAVESAYPLTPSSTEEKKMPES
jgi:hypothetical protein